MARISHILEALKIRASTRSQITRITVGSDRIAFAHSL
jgi:hypothetical protein